MSMRVVPSRVAFCLIRKGVCLLGDDCSWGFSFFRNVFKFHIFIFLYFCIFIFFIHMFFWFCERLNSQPRAPSIERVQNKVNGVELLGGRPSEEENSRSYTFPKTDQGIGSQCTGLRVCVMGFRVSGFRESRCRFQGSGFRV